MTPVEHHAALPWAEAGDFLTALRKQPGIAARALEFAILTAARSGEVLEEALARHGRPEIFNTDQGSQFTSQPFTKVLKDAVVRISMDGRGRWMDNVFIERLWQSMKYECVYLHAFESGLALHAGLAQWVGHYNSKRPHSALGGRTPDEAYHGIASPPPGHAPAAASLALAA